MCAGTRSRGCSCSSFFSACAQSTTNLCSTLMVTILTKVPSLRSRRSGKINRELTEDANESWRLFVEEIVGNICGKVARLKSDWHSTHGERAAKKTWSNHFQSTRSRCWNCRRGGSLGGKTFC